MFFFWSPGSLFSWFSALGLAMAAHGARCRTENRVPGIWSRVSNSRDPVPKKVSAARNSVSDSLCHSQAHRWRCFGPPKALCQSRMHCSCPLFFALEDEAISGFLCTTTKHTTLTTDPPAAPLPLQQNCPLGRRRPGRRMARGPPPIGPLLATPWSSTGPCRCLRSLSNRDSWVGVCVLTADRRHPPHSRSIGTAPRHPASDTRGRLSTADFEYCITGDQDRKEETLHPCPSAPQLWASQEQQHAVPFPQPWRRPRRRRRQHQWLTPSGKR